MSSDQTLETVASIADGPRSAHSEFVEALKQQKALLELILETVPEGINVKDCDRRVLLANSAFYRDHDLRPEQVLGKVPDGVLPPEMARMSRQTDRQALEDREATQTEITVTSPAGECRYFEVSKVPLIENGEVTGIVALSRDVTERKLATEKFKQQEALLLHASRLSSMGEMVAGIAHEVNQPLYSILNYAKAVKNLMNQDGELDIDSIREWSDHILSEAVRGGQITKRMRSFVSREETQRRHASINDIIEEALEFIIAEARHGQVTIHRELAVDVLPVVVDRVQIQQVLVNLCKNAIEAMAECSAENRQINVSTSQLDNRVEIAIEDNGPGISPEFGKTILEPFQTTRHEGIGLGLAISNTIIEQHRGLLSYHNNQHGGATFRFTLPTSQSEGS